MCKNTKQAVLKQLVNEKITKREKQLYDSCYYNVQAIQL